MKIDNSTVDKIAHLSRLELSATEKEAMIKDMNRIIEFMDKLNEVDTENVEPLIYLTNEVNVYRNDVLKQEVTVEDALLNAPKQDGKYFRVAKVINKP
ncbi:MAG TPA: Asp-tRNA(Asn)/Glu-tRNA(Gln) amidotransferase subunit GatC [Sphingobacteriaceae bacterium]|nr:Asp-tRNA(Asn)/Glu-tRNA(Gln) amidotransferase subunit GatC [Sphingobacteriaceae bacterium]